MSDKPRVPFKPESIEQLRARFPRALERVYEVDARKGILEDPPSAHPENVFDLAGDEIVARAIVSIDRDVTQREAATYLHCSVSFVRGKPAPLVPFWIGRVFMVLRIVAGDAVPESVPIARFGMTEGEVFHITTPWPPDESEVRS